MKQHMNWLMSHFVTWYATFVFILNADVTVWCHSVMSQRGGMTASTYGLVHCQLKKKVISCQEEESLSPVNSLMEAEKMEGEQTEGHWRCCVEVCSHVNTCLFATLRLEMLQNIHSFYKTCRLIDTSVCLTRSFYSAEIRVTGSNWDYYCCFLLWTVARALAAAVMLTLSLQQQ